MYFDIILTVGVVIAIFASIFAWFNTHVILKEIAELKNHLGIKENKKPSFLDDDLDKN